MRQYQVAASGERLALHDLGRALDHEAGRLAHSAADDDELWVEDVHEADERPAEHVADLDCDYYGTSLHKWLFAPHGTGFLFVRRSKIAKVWPLMAAEAKQGEDIRKFEEIGTHPAANHNAISAAIAFHRGIGAERKIARLRYLRDRWAKRLLAEGGGRVKMLTPLDSQYSGAIGLVYIDGMDMGKLGAWLLDRHKIVTTPIGHPEFNGIRITPSVYTSVDEIDTFGDAVLKAIAKGIA